MAKKIKRKIKKKNKTAQKQKQKQSQRTSVTVNIVNSKRKPRASAKPNTSRILQQFAQPIITLPSNLINPPQIPDMSSLNISPLQRGTNQGLTGNVIGEDLAARQRVQSMRNPSIKSQSFRSDNDSLFGYQEPSYSNVTPSFMGRPSDNLSNYPTPEQSLSGFSSPVPSNYTVETDSSSDVSHLGLSAGVFKPIEKSLVKKGRPKKQLVRVRQQNTTSGLSAAPPSDTGVPQAGNPSLRPPDERVTERLITGKKGDGQPLQMKPRVTRDEDYFFNLQRDNQTRNINDPRDTLSDSQISY